MKKLEILFLTLLLVGVVKAQIPNTFTLDEKVISIGTCFDISGVDGVIDQKIVSLTASFKLKINNRVVGSSKQQFLSWGSKIDIMDSQGRKIGTVEEKVFESIFSIRTVYLIYDLSHVLVASSVKHELMATKFEIKDTRGNVCCTITRPAINVLGDRWTLKISPSNKINKLMFIFIPCYKTYRDNEDK